MEWIGYASAILHLFVANTLIVLILVSHTIYPALWFKILLFCMLFSIFMQHVLIGGCIMSMFEERITQQTESPYRQLLEKMFNAFGITIEQYDKYFMFVIGISLAWMALEIISLVSSKILG